MIWLVEGLRSWRKRERSDTVDKTGVADTLGLHPIAVTGKRYGVPTAFPTKDFSTPVEKYRNMDINENILYDGRGGADEMVEAELTLDSDDDDGRR